MKLKAGFVLLLLAVIVILSVYSCTEAVSTVIAVDKTLESSYHTYQFSYKHLTDIQIQIPNADISFYTEPKEDTLLICTDGAAIEGTASEKTLWITGTSQQVCRIAIYLPERFYNIYLAGTDLKIRTTDTMRGTMQIQAERLQAELQAYYGGVSFYAKDGSVSLQNGNLQRASFVTLAESGNIYLNTRFTDTEEIYLFSTKNGAVRVYDRLFEEDGTRFDVYALSVFGSYMAVPIIEDDNSNDYPKVRIRAENGIAYFGN